MYNRCGENAKLSSRNGHLVAVEQWSGPERGAAVSAYYRNGDSVIAAQRVFRLHYEIPPRGQVPSAHAIRITLRIRMDLGEVGWGDVDWIGLAKDRNRWRAVVNSVLNLRVP
jgi:hypothetical protein